MSKVTVVVNKKHFDAAREARTSAAFTFGINETCLVAQAIKSIFPKNKVAVNYVDAKVGRKHFDLPKNAIRLIARFDTSFDNDEKRNKARQARLRRDLPVTFIMTEETHDIHHS